jgi:phage N-6-adenine-methyltransferase
MYALLRAGYRLTAFVHDEFHIELPIGCDYAAEAARIDEICCCTMGELTFGVPVETEYVLADRWSKNATQVRDSAGQLLVWTPRDMPQIPGSAQEAPATETHQSARASSVHFSSKKQDWATPQALFDTLNDEFGFEIDVCATPKNAKCERYFTPETDGLSQQWSGTCWMNPPYGRQILKWMKKAVESANKGATVVCLVPARTDTKWWHEYAEQGEVRFLQGRLKFEGSKNSAPFPSAVVVFRAPQKSRRQRPSICG